MPLVAARYWPNGTWFLQRGFGLSWASTFVSWLLVVRVHIEKQRHRSVITSNVRQQILTMNKKAREEWEKKQAETEKLQKQNEPESATGVDGDKEKDENRNQHRLTKKRMIRCVQEPQMSLSKLLLELVTSFQGGN